MATTLEDVPQIPTYEAGDTDYAVDPFIGTTGTSNHHRFSQFDSQLFALGPAPSPEQAKHALEAHLAETERRIQEASKLGTTLVQQRKELSDRLEEVAKQQNEGDITPELRQKLVEIEKEYNEVGRESARAFLPKSRVSSSEMAANSPFKGEAKRSVSPSKFESQATSSPSKLSVPNRKQRNQPANRVHDIEFATEISTSLLSQVRHLQALLAEKEESLRSVALDKSKLEAEAEGFHQRLQALDESEHRYKDENWNLETQIHEHIAKSKEAADREKKLMHSLHTVQTEKSSAQKDLDEIKLSHAKLAEEHAAAVKHHDLELGGAKRNMTMIENERGALQRKIEELTGQNQELAMAVAQHRGRADEQNQSRGLSDEDFETAADNVTPEHSPPPSPTKGTPRHSMLESETLKSSLHHAHRMIQNLKSNIHREKTEKVELKRMLQDARDELELHRSELGSGAGKRSRKVESKEFKKPLKPGQLGGQRSSKSEVYIDDTNWEEHNGQTSPSRSAAATASRVAAGVGAASAIRDVDSSDHFETANETSDAFETANERGTETEDFHTGAEDISGSDELTETETGPITSTARPKKPSALPTGGKAGNRDSFLSTASLSGDEYSYEDAKTPVTTQPQRMRLNVNRGSVRRSRADSEDPSMADSPASFANSSNRGTPQAAGQSLFAELEDLGDSDEDESVEGTPSRKSAVSPTETPVSNMRKPAGPSAMASPPLTRSAMVDSSAMTDGWEPTASSSNSLLSVTAGAGIAGAGLVETAHAIHNKHASITSDASSQYGNYYLGVDHGHPRPSSSTYSDKSSQQDVDFDSKLSKFPSPPSTPHRLATSNTFNNAPVFAPLTMSTIVSEHTEPFIPRELSTPDQKAKESTPVKSIVIPASLGFSSISSVATEPIQPLSPRSPRRDGVMIAGEEKSQGLTAADVKQERPRTPKGVLGSVFGWNKKTPTTPIIAEDETRQSPSDYPVVDTPESSRPFKEISANGTDRALKTPKIDTTDESSQTALTAAQIDNMLKEKSKRQDTIVAEDGALTSPSRSAGAVPGLRMRRSQESVGSVGRARSKMADPDFGHDTVPIRSPARPSSAGSNRASLSSSHPPLPDDHKQAIAAAAQRVGSSSGGQGSMGPPLLPASAYRTNPSFRPRTPSQTVASPTGARAGTTPRAVRAESSQSVYTPTGLRSRQSSVSSFASEVDHRFNIGRNGMTMAQGMDPGTDPRMIQAITQTMIGEYLWKYTRKAGRGEMSENRHRRYFWVHPYTRTLYWSDRDPSQAGKAELKAKSVAIEAVRVVTDDNPMPPGLHRKSLVILTPGRVVKFTASTGQRHETWFNALSYLLLRTDDKDNTGESQNVTAGALTREDVNEFNPGHANRSIRPGPASLSSYNSRTTRNESPARQASRGSMKRPTLAQSPGHRQSTGTFSRLSSYWKVDKSDTGMGGSFSSRRSRQSLSGNNDSIYQASEVHDSAEDLREIIEKQDRDSDRLENVRACCDGKHDVGHLHHHSSSKKGRHSMSPQTSSIAIPTAQRPGIRTQQSIPETSE